MRILIICLALVLSVAFCIAFLVFVAGLVTSTFDLVLLADGLLMVAALCAALSALGSKVRPTPMFTPISAGTIAAAATSLAIVVVNPQTMPTTGAEVFPQIPPPSKQAMASADSQPAPDQAMITPKAPEPMQTKEPAPPDEPMSRQEYVGTIIESPPPSETPPAPGADQNPLLSENFNTEVLNEPIASAAPEPMKAMRESHPSDELMPLAAPEGTATAQVEAEATTDASDAVGGPPVPIPRPRPCGEGGPPCP